MGQYRQTVCEYKHGPQTVRILNASASESASQQSYYEDEHNMDY